MNIFLEYLPKFKQEFFTLLFLCPLHVWWCFHYPLYTRLDYPWSTLVISTMSIIGVLMYIFLFSCANTFAPSFKFGHPTDISYNPVTKKNIFISSMAGLLIGFSILWRIDFIHVPSSYYILLYVYTLVVWALYYRAMQRVPLNS